jgi:hypothetical protein
MENSVGLAAVYSLHFCLILLLTILTAAELQNEYRMSVVEVVPVNGMNAYGVVEAQHR